MREFAVIVTERDKGVPDYNGLSAMNAAMNTILTSLDVQRAREFCSRGYWTADTLYSMLAQRADKASHRPFLRATNSRPTYREALRRVDAIAGGLDNAGVGPGDRVSIWLPSRIKMALVFLACSRMAYICNTCRIDRVPWATPSAEANTTERLSRLAPLVENPLKASDNADSVVYLAYTSGTMGQPKGVTHSDNTILPSVLSRAARL